MRYVRERERERERERGRERDSVMRGNLKDRKRRKKERDGENFFFC